MRIKKLPQPVFIPITGAKVVNGNRTRNGAWGRWGELPCVWGEVSGVSGKRWGENAMFREKGREKIVTFAEKVGRKLNIQGRGEAPCPTESGRHHRTHRGCERRTVEGEVKMTITPQSPASPPPACVRNTPSDGYRNLLQAVCGVRCAHRHPSTGCNPCH